MNDEICGSTYVHLKISFVEKLHPDTSSGLNTLNTVKYFPLFFSCACNNSVDSCV